MSYVKSVRASSITPNTHIYLVRFADKLNMKLNIPVRVHRTQKFCARVYSIYSTVYLFINVLSILLTITTIARANT